MRSGSLRRWLHLLLAFALAVSQLLLLAPTTALAAPIVTVNSTGDDSDLSAGDGVCDTGGVNSELDPECTLRAAIQEANASSVDEIHFDIPTSDPGHSSSPLSYTIQPLTGLPTISGQVDLDATTQPDFAGTPVIVVSGALLLGNEDGLTVTASGSEFRGLVVVGFGDDGFYVTGDNNTFAGNYIGVDVTGASASPNDDDGLQINGTGNVVGGSSADDRNVISGNLEDGVSVNGATNTDVLGNYIGLNAAGTSAIANAEWGVKVQLGSNGTQVGPDNVISGNTLDGIGVMGSSSTTIVGNYVGLDAAGTGAVANGDSGVLVGSSAGITDIGGSGAGEGNVISGNTDHGVSLVFGADVVTISSNRIGTNAAGTAAVANGQDGVRADSDDVIIEDNLVSGNTVDGLRIERLDAVVKGNLIGTDAPGSGSIPNGDDGIDTGSGTAGTMIGGTGAGDGNVIAHNGDNGIVLRAFAGTTAAILSNSIYANDGLGIDLGDDGPTANDPLDADPGPPNDLLNYPVITSAATAGSTVYVDYELDAPAGWHRIEFFTNPSGDDPSGFGEGETLVASTEVFHDGTGALGFSHTYAGSAGDGLSATATYCPATGCPAYLETSEFSATETIVVGNLAPDLEPIGDQTVDEATLASFTATASDPDVGDGLTYSLSGEPTGASINPTTGEFSWTPSESQGPGVYTFDVVVTDDGTPANLSDTESVTITVDEVNVSPNLTDPGDQTVDELATLSLTPPATDADDPANTLTFTLTGEPAGMSIDSSSGEITWTPTETQGPGVYSFDVTVTDDGTPNLGDTESIEVTVDEVDVAPSVTSPGDQANAEAESVNIPVSASDADIPANTLTYTATNLPPGLTIDPASGVITGTILYNGADGSPYTSTIIVSDDGAPSLDDQTTFTWTVTDTNRPPVLEPVANQTVDEQTTLSLTASANDPDAGNILTYGLDGGPAGAVIDPTTGMFSWTPTESQGPGVYTFDVTVTDNGSPALEDSETTTVVVAEANRAPVLGTIPNVAIDELRKYAFTATATDPDLPANTLAFSLIGGPSGATINSGTGAFTWTPTEAQGPGTYFVSVVVTDNGTPALSDSQTFRIIVREMNEAPVASDDATSAAEDTPVTIDVLANDQDANGDPLSISSVSTPTSGSVSVTPDDGILFTPDADFHGVVIFSYTVSDGITFATANVTVTVAPVNDAPLAMDDRYELADYQPLTLDVLLNDSDPDGDPLGISLGKTPVIGSVRLEDGSIVYAPVNGWTGSVTFTYYAQDSKGARSEATVEVIVGDEVLIGARGRAQELGSGLVAFDPPSAGLSDGIALIDLDGISLLADSFFQTVGALRIPLGFLGLTVAMVIGLGTASEVPALMLGSRRRHWSVVRLGRSQRLPAYSEPGGRKVVYNYDPTAEGVVSLGKTKLVGNTEWLPVDTPNGQGWIYRKYLTEQVDLQAFTSDNRPIRLVHELMSRLRRGKSIGSIVSPEGLIIALTGSPTQIAPERLSSLLQGGRLRNLPNNGTAPNTSEEFEIAVTQPLLEAYDATPDITAERAHSSSALIPTQCWNFPYLALGSNDGGQPWLVFFEYRNGRAWIAGIGIDE